MKAETDHMNEFFKMVDAQIKKKETSTKSGGDRRKKQTGLPSGQEERRNGMDRRGRARSKDSD